MDDRPDPVTGGALFPPGLLGSSVHISLNPKPVTHKSSILFGDTMVPNTDRVRLYPPFAP